MTLATPERWDEYFALADLPRAAGADFTIGGRRYGLFAHDFRQRSLDAWLELITERALSQEFTALPATEPQTLVLSQQEFTEAVRQALHDLHRSDLLARNPLLWTRLVRDRAVDKESAPSALESLLRDAVATLRVHPRDDKLFRAMDRTYLRPAARRSERRWRSGSPSAHTAATFLLASTASCTGCGTARCMAAQNRAEQLLAWKPSVGLAESPLRQRRQR